MSMVLEQIKELETWRDMIANGEQDKCDIKSEIDVINTAIDTIQALSAKLQARNFRDGWISVEDRLPVESLNSVIGWDEYRDRCCFVQYYNGRWILGNDNEPIKIIAWQDLPKPYKED